MARIAVTILAVVAGILFSRLLKARLNGSLAPEYASDSSRPLLQLPATELATGTIWGLLVWRLMGLLIPTESSLGFVLPSLNVASTLGIMALTLVLVGIARIVGKQNMVADLVMLPGIAIGCVFSVFLSLQMERQLVPDPDAFKEVRDRLLCAVSAAAFVLLIRWLCLVTRRLEVVGWGDAHLMAMLAAWLGLQGALLAFTLGALIGLALLAVWWLSPRAWGFNRTWALRRMPLGALVCAGGIVTCLWGQQIMLLALRWSMLPRLALKLP